jgi:hypothetical protein
MSTLNRTCEACGEGFYQYRGRPAKRCHRCRAHDRYGPDHRAFRAGTISQAIGKACARCGLPMLEGQPVQLDHADNGQGYIGYSHRSCNARAGAVRGNQLRAAAYRAAKGLPPPVNGSRAPSRVVAEEHSCEASGCHTGMAVCACHRHSRPW